MFKKLSIAVVFILMVSLGVAQTSQVSGTIKDTATSVSVKNAVVTLLSPTDSILRAFSRVKEDGSYTINNLKPGKYILSVSHPLFGDYVDDIEVNKPNELLDIIALTPKSKLLEDVIVRSGTTIRIKGDTTIYNASSFKVSANANVEELLKKLPGIQVDKNGQIKALGQTVEKVLVDGEEFFGDDPGMAVKNLRADAVKEVQVFDKKSEQAEFTGIDDGKTQKTINLKLKADKKKGYFGKIDVAGGLQKDIDHRFNDNILLGSFKGKRKITGFLLNGNTGQDGLNWQDEQKYGGSDNDFQMMDEDGGFNFYSRRGGSDDEPYVDASNGFITNVNTGVQYSNKFNEKTTVNFTPRYNSQRYNNNVLTYKRTDGDSVLNENFSTGSFVNRNNIKLKAIIDAKLDSASNNTLKLTAKANFYDTQSAENKTGNTFGNGNKFINSSDRLLNTSSKKQAISTEAVFKHKFKKARRTLSINADWSVINNDGNTQLSSTNNFGGSSIYSQNQLKEFDKTTGKVSSKIIYTEPLSKYYSLELGYQLSFNKGKNNSVSNNYNTATGKYDSRIELLTNNFSQHILQNTPSAKINYTYKKFKLNMGAGVSFTNFDLKDLSKNKDYDRKYTNFFPAINLNYSYKANHNLNLKYNGSTRQPRINQLQPLADVSDTFYIVTGNPDLQPTFTNNFSLLHNGYNFIKDMWSYQSLSINVENNSIANNDNIDFTTGRTTSQAININGNYNINFFSGLGMKLKKLDTRLGVNVKSGANRFISFRNALRNVSDNKNVGVDVYLSKSKEKKYDISLSVGSDYNVQKTTLGKMATKYYSAVIGTDVTVYIKKVWSISTDYNLYTRQKTANIRGTTNNFWNAKLARTFMKEAFTGYFIVRDILNQNIGIDRSFGNNTFTETTNDRLKRYWMIGFTWNFKNKAAAK